MVPTHSGWYLPQDRFCLRPACSIELPPVLVMWMKASCFAGLEGLHGSSEPEGQHTHLPERMGKEWYNVVREGATGEENVLLDKHAKFTM